MLTFMLAHKNTSPVPSVTDRSLLDVNPGCTCVSVRVNGSAGSNGWGWGGQSVDASCRLPALKRQRLTSPSYTRAIIPSSQSGGNEGEHVTAQVLYC